MEEQTSMLHNRQAGIYHYNVTRSEIGATKTAATLERALTITVHEILKHLTTRSLILVFIDQRIDRDGGCVDAQADPQVKRKERHPVCVLSRPLTRAQARWLDEHAGKLFERYDTKDELEVKVDALLEAARDNRKAAPYE